jgi:hypothetical protein
VLERGEASQVGDAAVCSSSSAHLSKLLLVSCVLYIHCVPCNL